MSILCHPTGSRGDQTTTESDNHALEPRDVLWQRKGQFQQLHHLQLQPNIQNINSITEAKPPSESRNYSRSQNSIHQASNLMKSSALSDINSHAQGRRTSINDLVDNCLPDLNTSNGVTNIGHGRVIIQPSSKENSSTNINPRSNNIPTLQPSRNSKSLQAAPLNTASAVPPVNTALIDNNKVDTLSRLTKSTPTTSISADSFRMEVGLENLGNTCFMNSTLQCLLHVKPLVAYFLKSTNLERELNASSPKKGVLATSFHHLVTEVYNKKNGSSVSPVNFQRAICTYAPYLMDYQQQDSQEFLRFLLDGMSEDLCRKRAATPKQSHPQQPVSNHGEGLPSSGVAEKPATRPAAGGHPAANSASKQISVKAGGTILPMLPQHGANTHHSQSAESSPNSQTSSNHSVALVETDSQTSNSKAGGLSHKLRAETRAVRDLQLQQLQQQSARSTGAALSRVNATITAANDLREEESDDDSAVIQVQPHPSASSGAAKAKLLADIRLSKKINSQLEAGTKAHNLPQQQSETDDRGESNDQVMGLAGRRSNRLKVSSKVVTDGQTPHPVATGPVPEVVPVVTGIEHLDTCLHESRKAWAQYLKLNDSVITDLFAGQLQSTITCLTCQSKSSTYDPFLDLSVPIHRDVPSSRGDSTAQPTRSFLGSIRSTAAFGSDPNKSTLEKCLQKFTAEEVLDGDNMYTCEKCKQKRKCVKKLTIFKYPRILVIHIKRFRFSSSAREKLSTDVLFPLADLDLGSYISADRTAIAREQLRRSGEDAAAVKGKDVVDCKGSSNQSPGMGTAREGESLLSNQESGRNSTSISLGATTTSLSSSLNSTATSLQSLKATSEASATSRQGDLHSVLHPFPLYDLIGVSNHQGSLHGGHYIAHVDTNGGDRSTNKTARWMCFNDARVSNANASSIAGPTAYVLFYKLREDDL